MRCLNKDEASLANRRRRWEKGEVEVLKFKNFWSHTTTGEIRAWKMRYYERKDLLFAVIPESELNDRDRARALACWFVWEQGRCLDTVLRRVLRQILYKSISNSQQFPKSENQKNVLYRTGQLLKATIDHLLVSVSHFCLLLIFLHMDKSHRDKGMKLSKHNLSIFCCH